VLSFVGDCTLASIQNKGVSYGNFERVVGTDYAWPFAATKQFFENDYLSLANLESTFTTATQSNGATFVFKADPAYAQILSEGSVEFVTLANNHSDDFLARGREDTAAALDAVGVGYAFNDGTYLYRSGDGPVIGIYCKLYPEVYGADSVKEGIAALREAGAEIVIAALHWGLEGSYQVTYSQEAVGRAVIDAGADVVWGSHSHVLQRVEEYGGGYIFYSLGNWSFGGNSAPRDRDTAILQLTVRRDPDGRCTLDGLERIPCRLSGEEAYNDYQPQPYDPEEPGYARALSKLDGSWNGADLSIDYSAFH